MPRQPVPHRLPYNTKSIIGPEALVKRPEHALLIAQSHAAWSYVEVEMSVLLGVLLKANSDAAIAVYHTLRRAAARVEAINAAAQITLNPKEKELMRAVLRIIKSAESERNSLAHGCFIAVSSVPDAIVWIESSKMAHATVKYHHHPMRKAMFGVLKALEDSGEYIADNAFYYTIGDLHSIVSQIKTVHDIYCVL